MLYLRVKTSRSLYLLRVVYCLQHRFSYCTRLHQGLSASFISSVVRSDDWTDEWSVQHPTLCPCRRASRPVPTCAQLSLRSADSSWDAAGRFAVAVDTEITIRTMRAVYMFEYRSGLISRIVECVWFLCDIHHFQYCFPVIHFVL